VCGIVGIVHHDVDHPASDLSAALSALAHRGPDDHGSYQNGHMSMGMARLSIIDLAGGHQPMSDDSKRYWIVFNGEIFNYSDLRAELGRLGYSFRSTSDTEVVLVGYRHWGTAVLDRLNGMFAFAIWDQQDRRLWIARDRLGIKPLYYTQLTGAFRFASEIKALLAAPEVPRTLSRIGLLNYLTYGHAIAPDTMFEGIFKLLPGHHLTYHQGTIRVAPYWTVPSSGQPRIESIQDAIQQSRALVEDAVRLHMVADVPVGAFLSGGIDSATLVGLMTRLTGKVKTFSLGFEDDQRNELSAARRLARHFGTDHYEANVSFAELPPLLEKLVYHFDEPFGDASCFPTYLVSRLAQKHVKVVLTGDGGDELFGGYVRYRAERMSPWVQTVPGAVRKLALSTLSTLAPRQHRLKRILRITLQSNPGLRYAGWSEVFSRDLFLQLVSPAFQMANYDVYAPYETLYRTSSALDITNRAMYTDLQMRLPNLYLEKVDKATMAASLEARVPLLDYRLVELAQRIPSTFKVSHRETKILFRQAVADLLPPDILNLPKHGFSVPTRLWFQGQLKDFVRDVLTSRSARERGIFDTSVVESVLDSHVDNRGLYETHLWLLLNFELWAQRYLDPAFVEPEIAASVVPKVTVG